MAHHAAVLTGMVNTQANEQYGKWTKPPLFGDIPTRDGLKKLNTQARAHLYSIPRGGSDLGHNVEGTDPGAGGGGNAVVQAQHTDRNGCSREVLLSMIDPGSALYQECSNPPFVTGRQIWLYLPQKVYDRPDDDEAQDYLRKVNTWTYLDLGATLVPYVSSVELQITFSSRPEGCLSPAAV